MFKKQRVFYWSCRGTVWMFLDTLGWRDLPATPSNIWWHTHEHPVHFSISPKHLFPWFHQFMALVNWWTVVSILQTWFFATAFWCMGIGASSTCREVETGWIKYRLCSTDGKETCCWTCGSVWHCACVDMMQHKSMLTSFLVALATRPWKHEAYSMGAQCPNVQPAPPPPKKEATFCFPALHNLWSITRRESPGNTHTTACCLVSGLNWYTQVSYS